jgi:hypothetical protein
MDEKLIDALTVVYDVWNHVNGLDLGAADDHLTDPNLKHEQRKWLETFSRLWSLSELTS